MATPPTLTGQLEDLAAQAKARMERAVALGREAHQEMEIALGLQGRIQALAIDTDEARKHIVYQLNYGYTSDWRNRIAREANETFGTHGKAAPASHTGAA